MLIIATQSELPGNAALLGVASPFVIALAVIGRYLMKKLDETEAEKKMLYERFFSQVVPSLEKSTTAIDLNRETLQRILDFVQDMQEDAKNERELRVRMEERMRGQDLNRQRL